MQLHGINRYGADGRFPREHKFSVETSYQVVTNHNRTALIIAKLDAFNSSKNRSNMTTHLSLVKAL